MLEVKNIDLFYGASRALKSVSLTAQLGKVTTVLGRNGVGRTSLLRAITGRQKIASGAICWDGVDVGPLSATARPRLFVLDEPTAGIQRSIIKDIGLAIEYLRDKGDMPIVLVEQYFEFARDLADDFAVMDRGEIVMQGTRAEMVEVHVQRHLTV